jgi:hypothetical protein
MKRVLDLGSEAGLGLLECQQQRFHRAVFHLLYGVALGLAVLDGILERLVGERIPLLEGKCAACTPGR